MNLTTVNVRADAIAEAERLKRARSLLVQGDESDFTRLEGEGTWIARSRKTRVRRRLSGRMCLIWLVVFENPSGRVVESMLVPMLVDLRGAARPHSLEWFESFIRQADDVFRARVDVECKAWKTRVTRLASAYSALRANRQRAIAGQIDRSRRDSQPGLFDRRAERERQTYASTAAETERAAALRLKAILEAARVAPRPARLLLVLLP
jgi:hypothetical protein